MINMIIIFMGEDFMRKSYYKFLLLALATIMLCSLTLLTACGGKETDAESTKICSIGKPINKFRT